jgi:hypothetical protein
MELFKKIFCHSVRKYLVAFCIACGLTVAYLVLNGDDHIRFYCDAFFIGGAATFLIGCLSCVSFYGAFDSFSFGFRMFRKDRRSESTLYDYVSTKQIERKKARLPYTPYMVIGVLFLIVSYILLIFIK